jgi:hypothetical protein
MPLGVACLKRCLLALAVLILTNLGLISCGGYGSSSSPSPSSSSTSKLKFRAVVSQDVQSTAATPGLILIDALKDLRANVRLITAGSLAPATMFLSSDRKITVVVSINQNQLAVLNNNTEAISAIGTIQLPGNTESVVVSADNATAYAAVPNAAVAGGGSIGAIAIVNLNTGGAPPTLPVPGVHYLTESGDGSKILAFSDDTDVTDPMNHPSNVQTVTVVSPFNIVAGSKNATCNPTLPNPPPPNPPPVVCQYVAGFDHPVAGFFSSDNTQAWILNCGPECGGTQASIQLLDLHDPANPVAGPPTPIPGGATVGFMQNQTLYVAGNPPVGSNTCAGGPTTAATTCGRLTIVNLATLPQATPIQPTAVIPDGYHTHIDISGDGQLFVGSRNCTNIVPATPGAEQRGCLAILNTNNGNLVIPPDNGDVTGMTPVTNRTVFYLIEGGELRIYDTTTDKIDLLESIDIFGNAVDVKLIDF